MAPAEESSMLTLHLDKQPNITIIWTSYKIEKSYLPKGYSRNNGLIFLSLL